MTNRNQSTPELHIIRAEDLKEMLGGGAAILEARALTTRGKRRARPYSRVAYSELPVVVDQWATAQLLLLVEHENYVDVSGHGFSASVDLVMARMLIDAVDALPASEVRSSRYDLGPAYKLTEAGWARRTF